MLTDTGVFASPVVDIEANDHTVFVGHVHSPQGSTELAQRDLLHHGKQLVTIISNQKRYCTYRHRSPCRPRGRRRCQ